MTRASTLLLALLVMNVLMGALCLVVARGERRSYALRLWGWGLLVYAAGILITIPDFLPFDARKVVGNALIAFAPVLATEGVLSHTRFRLNRRWVVAGLIASILPILFNHVGSHYVLLIDILAPAPIANVLFAIAVVMLLRDPPPDARRAAQFLAAILGFSIVLWSVRILSIVWEIGGTNDRDRADLTIALFSIAQIVIAVAATLGLLWIEERNMEAALRRMADTDALTGLPNRRATLARFEHEVARAVRRGERFAMLLLDVDRFKGINDAHGHLAGDAVLQHVAEVLLSGVRGDELVGRLGGEEFVLLIAGRASPDAVGDGQDQRAAETAARAAAERVRALVASSPATYGGSAIPVTLSGGLAMYPQDGTDWDALFTAADHRLYAAKRDGRDRIVGRDDSSSPAVS